MSLVHAPWGTWRNRDLSDYRPSMIRLADGKDNEAKAYIFEAPDILTPLGKHTRPNESTRCLPWSDNEFLETEDAQL